MNASTRRSIAARYREPAVARALDSQPLTMFHGWPGLALVLDRIRAAGASTDDLRALESSVAARLWQSRTPRGTQRPCASFMFGARGLTWARALVGSAAPRGYAPPSPEHRRGFDSFINDAPVFFALFGRDGADETALEQWLDALDDELCAAERSIERREPALLGFAHGIAGVVFRALLMVDMKRLEPARVRRLLRWLAAQRVDDGARCCWPARRGAASQRGSAMSASMCNGSIGHALVFLEAFRVLQDERDLELALRALAAADDEDALGLGFCCGRAGKVALVSRCLRLGLGDRIGRASEAWTRLSAALARAPFDARTELSAITGRASCLPALYADAPDSPVLDFFLPPLDSSLPPESPSTLSTPSAPSAPDEDPR